MKRLLALMAVFCTIVLAGSGAMAPCWADTLISFTDTSDTIAIVGFGIPATGPGVWYASWTQTVPTINTSIGAILCGGVTLGSGQAYLTNAVGPGTTMANQIAAVSFTPPSYFDGHDLTSAPVTTLFTGLSLNPGTYYLVLEQTANYIAWLGDGIGVGVNTAPGFTVVTEKAGYPIASYPPSTTFNENTSSGEIYFYTVEGTVVPLPPTVWLLGSSLLGLAGWRRLRKS